MINQSMAAFTSITANCARCHSHKFDPIPQEDYYALQAVFSGVLKGDIVYDTDLSPRESESDLLRCIKRPSLAIRPSCSFQNELRCLPIGGKADRTQPFDPT
jgi:hypothetical protein